MDFILHGIAVMCAPIILVCPLLFDCSSFPFHSLWSLVTTHDTQRNSFPGYWVEIIWMTGKWVPNIYGLKKIWGSLEIIPWSRQPNELRDPQRARGKMNKDKMSEPTETIFSLWANPMFTCSLKKKKSKLHSWKTSARDSLTIRMLVREGCWYNCSLNAVAPLEFIKCV